MFTKMSTLALIIVLWISACGAIKPLNEYLQDGIGQNVELKRKAMAQSGSYASRIGWKETTYVLPGGSWVFVEPDISGYYIHWEVNPEGKIVGYRIIEKDRH